MNHHLPARSDNHIGLVLTSRSYPPEPILNPSGLSPFIRLFAQVPFFIFQTMAMRKQSAGGRKTKTGCATCRLVEALMVEGYADFVRIRKIKCDEAKPFCQKCVKTGRTCDGYESVFRSFVNPTSRSDARSRVSPESTTTATLDATSLNRYFSTKTIFNVDVSCTQEAEQVIQASLTDPSIRHALLCLRTVREDLETVNGPEQQTLSYNYGLQQYSKALSGLASNLSSPSPETLKSALLCCQVLISVEQVRGNFSAMGMHIVKLNPSLINWRSICSIS